jgi:hypothetical protein
MKGRGEEGTGERKKVNRNVIIRRDFPVRPQSHLRRYTSRDLHSPLACLLFKWSRFMWNNNYAEPLLFSSHPGAVALVPLPVRDGSYGHVINNRKCVATWPTTLKSDFSLKSLSTRLDKQLSPGSKY